MYSEGFFSLTSTQTLSEYSGKLSERFIRASKRCNSMPFIIWEEKNKQTKSIHEKNPNWNRLNVNNYDIDSLKTPAKQHPVQMICSTCSFAKTRKITHPAAAASTNSCLKRTVKFSISFISDESVDSNDDFVCLFCAIQSTINAILVWIINNWTPFTVNH